MERCIYNTTHQDTPEQPTETLIGSVRLQQSPTLAPTPQAPRQRGAHRSPSLRLVLLATLLRLVLLATLLFGFSADVLFRGA
jgi:hypothetical protein